MCRFSYFLSFIIILLYGSSLITFASPPNSNVHSLTSLIKIIDENNFVFDEKKDQINNGMCRLIFKPESIKNEDLKTLTLVAGYPIIYDKNPMPNINLATISEVLLSLTYSNNKQYSYNFYPTCHKNEVKSKRDFCLIMDKNSLIFNDLEIDYAWNVIQAIMTKISS